MGKAEGHPREGCPAHVRSSARGVELLSQGAGVPHTPKPEVPGTIGQNRTKKQVMLLAAHIPATNKSCGLRLQSTAHGAAVQVST